MFSKLAKGLKWVIPISASLYLVACGDAYVKYRNSHKIISWARACKHPPDLSVINQDISDLPQEVDWRQMGAVTDVSDQGECNSCYAFGSVEAVEGIYKIIYGKLVKLSAQEILDNSEAGSNSGGSLLKSFQYIKDNGIGLQSDYPYTGTKTAFTLNKEGKKRIFIDDYKILQPNYYDEISLMRAVAKQPVVVSVVVGLRFKYYMGGVFKHGLPWINPVSHSLLVVGYGESEEGKYWICKNTYGETWGENGYIYLERNQGTPAGSCGMLSCAYYPVINSDQGVKHAIEKSEIDNVSSPRHHSSQAFERVKRSPGPIFSSTGVIDKIRSSKYFQALLKPSKEKDCNKLVDQLGKQNKTGSEASQVSFGDGSKNNNSEGCLIIERPQSHGIPTEGPGVSYVKSPSCKEEVIPDVAARGKLVTPEISGELSDSRNRGEKEKEDDLMSISSPVSVNKTIEEDGFDIPDIPMELD